MQIIIPFEEKRYNAFPSVTATQEFVVPESILLISFRLGLDGREGKKRENLISEKPRNTINKNLVRSSWH